MEANPKPKDASKALCEALLAHSERGSGSVLPAEAVNLAANAAQPLNLPIKHQPNLLLPLLSALRARGCTALASQYVMRFGPAGRGGGRGGGGGGGRRGGGARPRLRRARRVARAVMRGARCRPRRRRRRTAGHIRASPSLMIDD